MTRPDYSGWLTDEDVTRIVKAFAAAQPTEHECKFPEEERQIIRDIVSGGKALKKAVIYLIVALVLYALIAKSVLLKAGQLIGWLK
jgi:hypothetical protein